MKIGAVISEYNPFHNGHKYQIETIKNEYKIDKLIVIMSGDFTERGEPAIISKESRAKHALLAGADLVLLLPLVYSTSGADLFAFGAVSILDRLNVVDYLFFGSECGNIEILKKCARACIDQDDLIAKEMKNGFTYAKARNNVLNDYNDIISSPNNILGIEYIKALYTLNSTIEPITIKRTDDNYNNESIEPYSFASAKAIRSLVFRDKTSLSQDIIPEYVIKDLLAEHPITANDFSNELYYAILIGQNSLEDILDVSPDLKNRIIANIDKFTCYTEFNDLLKSKNFTYTRLSRALLHILFEIKNTNSYYKEKTPELTHVKILGFRKSASDLLSVIGKKSSIKLTSKIPDIYNEASSFTRKMFDTDLLASQLYSRKSGNSLHEYQRIINIIDL